MGFAAAVSLLGGRAVAQERRVLRAAGPPNDGFKAMYYGQRSGIFAKYGLDVQITSVNNGAAAAAALIGGAVDVVMTNILALIQAHRRGVPMTLLAANSLDTAEKPNMYLLVRKDAPIHSGRDLNGKTVALPGLSDIGGFGTKAWIDRSGGDSRTVRFLEVGTAALVAALLQGRADAATITEPFASQGLATGGLRIVTAPLDAIAPRFEAGAYAVMEPFVAQNLDAMHQLALGLHEAVVYCNSHLAETADLVASYSGATLEVIAKMNRFIDPEYVDVRLIQPVIDAAAKYGAVDQAFPASELISAAALRAPARELTPSRAR